MLYVLEQIIGGAHPICAVYHLRLRLLMFRYKHIAKSDPLEARHFTQHINDCMNDWLHYSTMLGLPELCQMDPVACGSKLLYLHHLAPHYPNCQYAL